jgi:hypothetical protein
MRRHDGPQRSRNGLHPLPGRIVGPSRSRHRHGAAGPPLDPGRVWRQFRRCGGRHRDLHRRLLDRSACGRPARRPVRAQTGDARGARPLHVLRARLRVRPLDRGGARLPALAGSRGGRGRRSAARRHPRPVRRPSSAAATGRGFAGVQRRSARASSLLETGARSFSPWSRRAPPRRSPQYSGSANRIRATSDAA